LEDETLTLARGQRWGTNPTSEPLSLTPIEFAAQTALLRNFAHAIRSGEPAETSGQDNLWSFGAVMAAVRSAREGRAVDVAEVMG
jgi:predicted dehydrogenase